MVGAYDGEGDVEVTGAGNDEMVFGVIRSMMEGIVLVVNVRLATVTEGDTEDVIDVALSVIAADLEKETEAEAPIGS